MVIDSQHGVNSAGNVGSARNKAASDKSTAAEASEKGAVHSRELIDNPGSESVSLSQEAQSLTRLEAKIKASAEVDTERVAALRDAIADGSFEVNAERIAERLLVQEDLSE